MKITVKTTQQKVFQVCSSPVIHILSPFISSQVDADPEDTIAAVKIKIEQSQGHPAGVQKIIYAGQSYFRLSSSL